MPVTIVEGRRLPLSNLDKVLYPATGTTKGQVLHYYATVASTLLPHIYDRPVSLVRCPDGVDGQRFFAKHIPPGTPAWVRTVEVESSDGGRRQIVIEDVASLIWAANLAGLELHVPQWHAAEPGQADRLVLDLDPGEGADIMACRTVALLLRERLADAGLTSWIKTSGSKGLHLLVPLHPTASEQVCAYTKALAMELEAAHPDLVVHTMPKTRRIGRVLLDWSQNNASKTTAAPYTLRARPAPTVSTPITWEELAAATTPAELAFTIDDIPTRLAARGDILAPLLHPTHAHDLPPAPEPAHRPSRSPAPPATAPVGPAAGTLVLEPPVEVMRPKAVTVVPQEDGLAGGVLYEIKLDGFRCVAFAHGNRPAYLQSRSGRDLAPEFPVIADAVAALPAGLVLDSELCAWRSGKFAFEELLRSPRARACDPEVALALIVFDVLALPGRDVRALPLAQRRELLQQALADLAPPIQMVMATTDRSQAMDWYEHLAPAGVEGLVCKALSSSYRARGAGTAWVKIRRTDTTDATVTAITGTPRRPRALVVVLDDGTRTLTSPQLDTVQARNLAQAMADRLGEPVEDPDHGTIHPLRTRLRAELQLRTDRHPAARYVRLRGD